MLCACIPVVTFLLVRYLHAVDSPELSALWIHAFFCCLGALVILLQACENDKLRHATVEKMSGTVRGRFSTSCFCSAVVGFRYLHGRYSSGA